MQSLVTEQLIKCVGHSDGRTGKEARLCKTITNPSYRRMPFFLEPHGAELLPNY